MSYLQQQMNYLKYDKRLLEINLKNGTITEEEHRQFLQDLADETDKTEKLNLDPGSESNETREKMNGDHHPADESRSNEGQNAYNSPPATNTDPFGSGY